MSNFLRDFSRALRRWEEVERYSYIIEYDGTLNHDDFVEELLYCELMPQRERNNIWSDSCAALELACKRRFAFPQGIPPPHIYGIAHDCKVSYVHEKALNGSSFSVCRKGTKTK